MSTTVTAPLHTGKSLDGGIQALAPTAQQLAPVIYQARAAAQQDKSVAGASNRRADVLLHNTPVMPGVLLHQDAATTEAWMETDLLIVAAVHGDDS